MGTPINTLYLCIPVKCIFDLFFPYRYSEDGFKQARAKPYKPQPSLKIAIEGKRHLSPEKKEVYVRFASRPSRSARPDHER